MQLNSSVAPIYFPEVDQSTVLRLGLRRFPMAQWLCIDADHDQFHAHKVLLGSSHANKVYQSLPDSIDAQRELHGALLAHLKCNHRAWLEARLQSRASAFTGLWHSSLLVQEDLCILESVDDTWRLTAASLCSPSNWKLEQKIGRSLNEIHDPVPGYRATLATRVERLLDRLRPGKPLLRFNWSLQPGNELCWRDDIASEADATDWHWRVERQTLIRLPATGAAVFGIRIYLHSLAAMQKHARESGQADCVQTLAALLRRLPEAERVFKGLTRVRLGD